MGLRSKFRSFRPMFGHLTCFRVRRHQLLHSYVQSARSQHSQHSFVYSFISNAGFILVGLEAASDIGHADSYFGIIRSAISVESYALAVATTLVVSLVSA